MPAIFFLQTKYGYLREGRRETTYNYEKIHIVVWVFWKWGNRRTKQNKIGHHRVPKAKVLLSWTCYKVHRQTGEPMQLSNGIQEIGNDQLEDFYNDGKMRLSSNSNKHG